MHTVVLSIDEKSQIPGARPHAACAAAQTGQVRAMTHDYKRNGVTTLFAALNVRTGGARPLHGPASPAGVNSLPQRHLGRHARSKSVDDLEQAVARYIREHNGDAKPVVWTKPAKAILDKQPTT